VVLYVILIPCAVIVEVWVQTQGGPCGICGGQCDICLGLSINTASFDHHYYSINVPYSYYILQTRAQYNRSKWQRRYTDTLQNTEGQDIIKYFTQENRYCISMAGYSIKLRLRQHHGCGTSSVFCRVSA